MTLLKLLLMLFMTSYLFSVEVECFFSKTKGRFYKNGVDNIIVKDINRAKKSIFVASYYLTNKQIISVLKSAYKNGISVKIVTDDKRVKDRGYKILNGVGIDIHTDSNSTTLQHNKFIVIDRYIVWSGSGNYTVYSFYRNNDNYIRVKSKSVAKRYIKKFNALYNGKKEKITPYKGRNLEVYFSPDEELNRVIIKYINRAKKSIKFMLFAFTDKEIADALILAKKRGVTVEGIFDRVQNRYQHYSKYDYLKSNNIAVYLDNNRYKLHNKVLIVDNRYVLTGSYNYTHKGSSQNSENLIVIKNRQIAQKYINEYNKIKSIR